MPPYGPTKRKGLDGDFAILRQDEPLGDTMESDSLTFGNQKVRGHLTGIGRYANFGPWDVTAAAVLRDGLLAGERHRKSNYEQCHTR